MGNTILWVIYPTENCRHPAEVVKPVCGAMCTPKCSGATCTVSVFDLGWQAEGGLTGAVAPHAIWAHCRGVQDVAHSGWEDLSEGKESAEELGCIFGTYDLSYISVGVLLPPPPPTSQSSKRSWSSALKDNPGTVCLSPLSVVSPNLLLYCKMQRD